MGDPPQTAGELLRLNELRKPQLKRNSNNINNGGDNVNIRRNCSAPHAVRSVHRDKQSLLLYLFVKGENILRNVMLINFIIKVKLFLSLTKHHTMKAY